MVVLTRSPSAQARDALARIDGIRDQVREPPSTRYNCSSDSAITGAYGSPWGSRSSRRATSSSLGPYAQALVEATLYSTCKAIRAERLERLACRFHRCGCPGRESRRDRVSRLGLQKRDERVLADEPDSIRSIPGSFSRVKEKKGRQGKLRKAGKLRNTCEPILLAENRPSY